MLSDSTIFSPMTNPSHNELETKKATKNSTINVTIDEEEGKGQKMQRKKGIIM